MLLCSVDSSPPYLLRMGVTRDPTRKPESERLHKEHSRESVLCDLTSCVYLWAIVRTGEQKYPNWLTLGIRDGVSPCRPPVLDVLGKVDLETTRCCHPK